MSGTSGSTVSDSRAFLVTAALGGLIVAAPLAVAPLAGIDLAAALNATLATIAAGAVATAPMLAGLYWFMGSKLAPIVRFRTDRLADIKALGFTLTPGRNLAIALLAGVGEELLFRGIMQASLTDYPVAVAVVLPNIVFGALHARKLGYALLAFGVGVYLGWLTVLTESLAAPILAHAAYDFAALEAARRIMAAAVPPADIMR
ncbi:MAG: lysostaphin resistance A-like protein [Parvularculaceae bacterium]